MLILKLTRPPGESKYIAAAFPSACGKTNLAMLDPTLLGWKVKTIGDDIAWMKFGQDGRLYAINPEAGFFGVAPGTSYASNANAMKTIARNTIFTNCALTDDSDVWWEGMTRRRSRLPHRLDPPPLDRQVPPQSRPPQRPLHRPRQPVPRHRPRVGGPERRPHLRHPLRRTPRHHRPPRHGSPQLAARRLPRRDMASETTAAAAGKTGTLRRDPMAMLPFCGYHMGDYFAHWLKMGQSRTVKRRGSPDFPRELVPQGSQTADILWPGYGENARVLKWIFDRCNLPVTDPALATQTPIGYLPTPGSIDRAGLPVSDADMKELLRLDPDAWLAELPSIETHYALFGERLPPALNDELRALAAQLK